MHSYIIEKSENFDEIYEMLVKYNHYFRRAIRETEQELMEYAEKLAQRANVLLVKKDGEIYGCMAYYYNEYSIDEYAYVTMCVIDSELQREGLAGGRIVSQLFAVMQSDLAARTKGMRLAVEKSNQHAIGVYEKLGAKYIADKDEDSFYMILNWSEMTRAARMMCKRLGTGNKKEDTFIHV